MHFPQNAVICAQPFLSLKQFKISLKGAFESSFFHGKYSCAFYHGKCSCAERPISIYKNIAVYEYIVRRERS